MVSWPEASSFFTTLSISCPEGVWEESEVGESTTASTGIAARSGSIFGRAWKRKIEARWKNGGSEEKRRKKKKRRSRKVGGGCVDR